MTSDINQVLPLALSQLVNQNPSIGAEQRLNTAQYATPRDISYLTQVAAAQTVSKVRDTDKERATQVPKRSEPDFSPQEDKPEDESPPLLKNAKGKAKKHTGNLDLVA